MFLGPVVLWLFLWGLTDILLYQRWCKVSVWCRQKLTFSLQMGVGHGCIPCWSQERLLPCPDLSLRGCISPLGSPAVWHNTIYGHAYPYWAFLCYSPAICNCRLKPALVLPHWATPETECSWRCLERGLLGNPELQQRCSCESCTHVPCA